MTEAPGLFAVADGVERSARLSECGTWRYYLARHWAPKGEALAFVMLNPSTADATVDDPTIRRCIGFARRDGYAGLVVVNLFALRSTDPAALGQVLEQRAVGPDNDAYLSMLLAERVRRGLPTVAAWGAHPGIEKRIQHVRALVPGIDWRCLGTTKAGAPRHPLYVRGDQPLAPLPVSA
jgi:hypothetical protein